MSKILWKQGQFYVESFLNQKSLFFYIRDTKRIETCIVLNIEDLADIIKAVVKRATHSRISEPPTNDDLPF